MYQKEIFVGRRSANLFGLYSVITLLAYTPEMDRKIAGLGTGLAFNKFMGPQ